MGNLYRITWAYTNRADYTAVETVGFANWLHERLHGETRHHFGGSQVMSVTAEPVNGEGKSWQWLNPDADDASAYRPAHARNSVDAGAQGV